MNPWKLRILELKYFLIVLRREEFCFFLTTLCGDDAVAKFLPTLMRALDFEI